VVLFPYVLRLSSVVFLKLSVLYDRVDSCLSVRLSDGALSSDVFPRDYGAIFNDTVPLPVKWMAVESLEDSRYTTYSDMVMAIGCILSLALNFSSASD